MAHYRPLRPGVPAPRPDTPGQCDGKPVLPCGARLEESTENFFSATRGGIVCGKCFSGEQDLSKISSDQIKLLRIFLANPLEKILKVNVGKVELAGLGKIRQDFERYNF